MSKKGIIQFFCMSLIILNIFVAIIVYRRNLDDYVDQLNTLNRFCRCRLSRIERIVNGQVHKQPFVPWAVSIAVSGRHRCMGVVVNKYHVLTAQHCINHTTPMKTLEVRCEIYDLFDPQMREKTYHVHEIHKFLSFDYTNNLNGGDLTFLKLSTPFKFHHGKCEPACLDLGTNDDISHHQRENSSNQTYLSTGFGTDSPVAYMNQNLISRIHPSFYLKMSYSTEVNESALKDSRFKYSSEKFISIRPLDDKQDLLCHGFSGTALNSMHENGLTTVKGIASTSIPIQYNETVVQFCRSYSLFVRLSYKEHRNFIEGVIGDLRCRADLIEKNITHF